MLVDLTGSGSSYGKFLGRKYLSMWEAYFHHFTVELYSHIVMILQQIYLKDFAGKIPRFDYKVTLGKI